MNSLVLGTALSPMRRFISDARVKLETTWPNMALAIRISLILVLCGCSRNAPAPPESKITLPNQASAATTESAATPAAVGATNSSSDISRSPLGFRAEYQRCQKAAGNDIAAWERCIVEELAYQDSRLNRVYKERLSTASQTESRTLRNAQRDWLRDTNQRCVVESGELDCRLKRTTDRADELVMLASSLPVLACAARELTLFECALPNRTQAVLCASSGASESAYMYFEMGDAPSSNMQFPGKKEIPRRYFKKNALSFAGDTTGQSYSFVQDGKKYILYSVSGRYGFEEQGIIVTQANQRRRILEEFRCIQTSKTNAAEWGNPDFNLSPDLYIEENGLPLKVL